MDDGECSLHGSDTDLIQVTLLTYIDFDRNTNSDAEEIPNVPNKRFAKMEALKP